MTFESSEKPPSMISFISTIRILRKIYFEKQLLPNRWNLHSQIPRQWSNIDIVDPHTLAIALGSIRPSGSEGRMITERLNFHFRLQNEKLKRFAVACSLIFLSAAFKKYMTGSKLPRTVFFLGQGNTYDLLYH